MTAPHFTVGPALHFAEPALAPRRHQFIPRTFQRMLKPQDGGEENVDVARLDLLHGADVEVHQFGETFLRQILSRPRSADVGTEGHRLGIFSAFRHAPLGRTSELTNTAQQGVNCRHSHTKMRPYIAAMLQSFVPLRAASITMLLAVIFAMLPVALTAQDAADSQRQAIVKYPAIAKAGSPLNTRFVTLYNDAKEYNPALLSTPNWPIILADRAAGANVVWPEQKSPSLEQTTQLQAKADKGDPKAQFYLGFMYEREIIPGTNGSQKFRSLAKAWYRKAAEQGLADAQCSLGNFVEVFDQDLEEALKWYLKAAKQGLAEAQNNLGSFYGSPRAMEDQQEATRWYRKAAEQGWIIAQNRLSHRFRRGIGVPKDNSEAYKWMSLAAAQGDLDANEWIKILDQDFTPEERAEGQKKAREFQPAQAVPDGK